MRSFLIVICLLFVSFPARAGLVTGGDLLRLCAMDKEQTNVSCQGYVAGVIDYHILIRSLGTSPSVEFCVPQDEPIERITDVVLKHLAEYPEHDSFLAAPAVAMALFLNYPCP